LAAGAFCHCDGSGNDDRIPVKRKTLGNRFFTGNRRTSLQELVELVKARYVDKMPADSINQLAADELLSHLDPHSVYIPADKLKKLMKN
jgi:carboxyl-terminal processing protease